jgi:hypothetical protein
LKGSVSTLLATPRLSPRAIETFVPMNAEREGRLRQLAEIPATE